MPVHSTDEFPFVWEIINLYHNGQQIYKLFVVFFLSGSPETHPLHYPFLTRYKNWGLWPFDWPCAGQRVRLVCIFGVGDLNLLSSRPELFANKFYLDYQPLAFDCMERLHYQRMREEVLGQRELDTTYYESLSFVKNHV